MSEKRQEKSLREFKQILEELALLLGKSTDAHTVYMFWVNRSRRQFVLETSATTLPAVMFRDRVPFEEHFLHNWAAIRKPAGLAVPDDLATEKLTHHHGEPPVGYVHLIPFVNRSETVAITVLEFENPLAGEEWDQAVAAYRRALGNVLNTWLELTDLQQKEKEWPVYEEGLEQLSPRLHRVELIERMLNQMQKLLPTGGASFIARGMGSWVNVLNTSGGALSPDLGQVVDENSMAFESLKSGQPRFAIHFNHSPKRLSSDEGQTDGATLAIPLLIDDRRQGAVLAYDQNPLVFTESVRHKLVNLLRVTGLAIRPGLERSGMESDLLTSEYGSFIPDLWERSLSSSARFGHPLRSVWFGFLTLGNLQQLRSRFRLDMLKSLQRELVTRLNPSRFGKMGYVGFHSDYVFSILLQDADTEAPGQWLDAVTRDLDRNAITWEGERIPVVIRCGLAELNYNRFELHDTVRRAKVALDRSVRDESPMHVDAAGHDEVHLRDS